MHGDLSTFAIGHAYPEAVVRGMRSGFLSDTQYDELAQCANMEDLKSHLVESDYGQFLQNEVGRIEPSTVRHHAQLKLAREFEYLRASSVNPLTKFLDFVRFEFMIDNLILILHGTLNNPDVDVNLLMEQCHPMGMLDPSVMRSIAAFENTEGGYMELYESVLVETPVGKYFGQFLKEQVQSQAESGAGVRTILRELPLALLEHSVRKLYLEDFYAFCLTLDGETPTVMARLLSARADATTIMITLNSFNTPLNEETNLKDRAALYPSFGAIYEGNLRAVAEARTEEALGLALEPFPVYKDLWAQYRGSETKTMIDLFNEREVMMMEDAFEGQAHSGVFYAFVRLKRQEIDNLGWMSECIVQRMMSHIDDHCVRIFSAKAPWRHRS